MIVGIVLIGLGAAGLAVKKISYTTTKKVAELGPIKIERKNKEAIAIPEWASGAAIGAGAVLAISGLRRKRR